MYMHLIKNAVYIVAAVKILFTKLKDCSFVRCLILMTRVPFLCRHFLGNNSFFLSIIWCVISQHIMIAFDLSSCVFLSIGLDFSNVESVAYFRQNLQQSFKSNVFTYFLSLYQFALTFRVCLHGLAADLVLYYFANRLVYLCLVFN